MQRDKDGESRGGIGEERERKLGRGVTKTDGTLGIHLSLKSVSAVFLMCMRL